MDLNHDIPDYEIDFDTYSLMDTEDIFQLLIKCNKKAIECVKPNNQNFYPNDLLVYLDKISIIRDILILNKPLPELKKLKEGIESDLGNYLYHAQTVSKSDQRKVGIVVEHIKGELEEANQYLAEAISLRR